MRRGEGGEGGRRAGRILALEVPLFPLAAVLRSDPGLRGEAVVVYEGEGGAARVLAATRPARRLGVRAGLTLAQARSLVPELKVRPRDPAAEASAREALLEAAGTVSPRIEDAEPGLVLADLTGTERLHPSEEDLARAALRAAAHRGLPARAGVGSNRLVARLAARRSPTPWVVASGTEQAALAPLPVEVLAPSPAAARRLGAWGIATLGDLARLSGAEVAVRLGSEGAALHRAARGIDPHPLVPTPPGPVLAERRHLDWPVTRLEPFLAEVRPSLEALCTGLAELGLSCAELELEVVLDPGGAVRRAVCLPAPTADPEALLGLLRLELERAPPGAPATGYVLRARPAVPRRAQLELFGPEAPSPQRLETAVARIAARLGPGRVGATRSGGAHLSGPPSVVPFHPPPPPPLRRPPVPARGALGVRRLEPPRPLEVAVAGRRPVSVATPRGVRPRLAGLVRVASGPWPVETGWWEESPEMREYWDVELSGGHLARIFRRPGGRWFVDGLYD